MDSLTFEQGAKLDALLAELASLPTPELNADSGRLRCGLPLDDVGKKRMRLALSGAFAAEKILAYLQALEEVDNHRGMIGRRIFELHREGKRLRALESLDAVEPLVMASHLSGWQEVDFHFFAVCVGRIERFLPIAARAAGYKIPREDRDLLAPYRALRDYYEHLEDRLPAGKHYDEGAETHDEREWRVRIGLTLDGQERIVLSGVAVDVTPRGVAAVRGVLRRNWEQLAPSTLTMVRKHFEAKPSDIPGPGEVKQNLLASTGEVA